MDYIRRDIEKTVIEASELYSALIVTGPRQVGKTTTLRRLAESNRAYVTLDDIEARRMAKDDPELFLSVHRAPLLIDEVQYAPELFSRIKIEIDRGASPANPWQAGSRFCGCPLCRSMRSSGAVRMNLSNLDSQSSPKE